jgi:hypothetical protein
MLRRAAGLAAVLLVLIVAACGAANPTIRGIVVDVEGDLVDVERFTMVTEDGERLELEPAPDVRFHDGAPLSHLTEHLRNGSPIDVTYRVLDDGTLAALRVEDVGE